MSSRCGFSCGQEAILRAKLEEEKRKAQAALEEEKRKVQARVEEERKRLENEAKAKAESQGKKAVDNLKKKFGF